MFALCFTTALALLTGVPRGLGRPGDRVALVEVEGLIVDADRVVRELDAHGENPAIRAVVVRIQSPGGVVAPTQEIHAAILRLRDRGKPVVASMGSVAASGGYYLATAADQIVAAPGTLTGSIGVLIQLAEASALLHKVGVRYEIIKAGRFKDAGTFSRAISPEERAVLQGVLDDMYDQFVSAVAEGRHLSRAAVLAAADGRVYTGRRARELGLVDTLGGLDDAVRLAGRLAGLPDKPRVYRLRRPWRLGDLVDWASGGVLGRLGPVASGLAPFPPWGTSKLPLYLME